MNARALLLASLVLAFGCTDRRVDDRPVLDAPTMAFLSAARALHHQCDLSEREGKDDAALRVMNQLLDLTRPPARAPEIEETLADAYARRAELLAKQGDYTGAEADIREGLRHASEPTYFRGHLLEVHGVILSRKAVGLTDAGNTAEASETRRRANERLSEAVRIQEEVIRWALSDGGK